MICGSIFSLLTMVRQRTRWMMASPSSLWAMQWLLQMEQYVSLVDGAWLIVFHNWCSVLCVYDDCNYDKNVTGQFFFIFVAVSELSKMYPTPPSNNTSNDRTPPHDNMENHILEKPIIKTDFIPTIKEDFFRVSNLCWSNTLNFSCKQCLLKYIYNVMGFIWGCLIFCRIYQLCISLQSKLSLWAQINTHP